MEHTLKIEDFEAEAVPHLGEIYRTARRMVGSAMEAEDVVQDVFLQAWRSFDRFHLGTNCRAWLYTILFNKLRHHSRAQHRSRVVAGADSFLEEVVAYEPPVPETIVDEDILHALDRVPEVYREAVLMADVQEFAYREIADILGIPIGTVMSRVNRGRKLLRIELADVAQLHGIRDRRDRGAMNTTGPGSHAVRGEARGGER